MNTTYFTRKEKDLILQVFHEEASLQELTSELMMKIENILRYRLHRDDIDFVNVTSLPDEQLGLLHFVITFEFEQVEDEAPVVALQIQGTPAELKYVKVDFERIAKEINNII